MKLYTVREKIWNRIEVSSNGRTFQTVAWHWCGSADRLVPLLFFHYLSFLHLAETCWQPFQEHLQAKAKTKNNDKFEFSSQWGSDNQPNRPHNSWVAWVNLDTLNETVMVSCSAGTMTVFTVTTPVVQSVLGTFIGILSHFNTLLQIEPGPCAAET